MLIKVTMVVQIDPEKWAEMFELDSPQDTPEDVQQYIFDQVDDDLVNNDQFGVVDITSTVLESKMEEE